MDPTRYESNSQKEKLQGERAKILASIITTIEKTILDLKKAGYESFQKPNTRCRACDSLISPDSETCYECARIELTLPTCDAGSRVCEFLTALESVKLFPLFQQAKGSPIDFMARLKKSVFHMKHGCDGYKLCPLIEAVKSLENKTEKVVDKYPGLSLQDLKSIASEERQSSTSRGENCA